MPKGFASFSKEKLKKVASLGGKSAHAKGKAHEWTSEEASKAGEVGRKKSAEKRQRKRHGK